MGVEDRYPDVLQNIEFGIVVTYRACPRLSDYDVMRTLEAIIDTYTAERIGRPRRQFKLSDEERILSASIRSTCEWRLGRGNLPEEWTKEMMIGPEPKTVDEIILCLKRILKSVKRWNARGGRQGYLNFIIQHVR